MVLCARPVNRETVEQLLRVAATSPGLARYGALFLLSYAFLLRLPSEALPVVCGEGGGQSSLFRDGEDLVLVLAKRCGHRDSSHAWCE